MLRPKLMTGKDLDDTVTATRHLLGCGERYGVIEPLGAFALLASACLAARVSHARSCPHLRRERRVPHLP
jgi:hypothetical protein